MTLEAWLWRVELDGTVVEVTARGARMAAHAAGRLLLDVGRSAVVTVSRKGVKRSRWHVRGVKRSEHEVRVGRVVLAAGDLLVWVSTDPVHG